VGQGLITPEFDTEVTGLKIGEEKSFTLKLKEDYPISEIAGKEVSFKVKLNKINRKELIPLDNEFSKKISGFGTLAELKEELKRNIDIEKKDESDADLKNQLIEAVSSASNVEIPQSMVKVETDIMVDELSSSLARSNLTLEGYLKSIRKTEDEVRSEFKNAATARAKGKVILKKIAEVENLQISDADMDTEIALMAQGSNKSVEEYKKSMSHGATEYVKDYILRRKALDFLVSSAKIEA